jgi:uncharacterized paraquat-inducible protein A
MSNDIIEIGLAWCAINILFLAVAAGRAWWIARRELREEIGEEHRQILNPLSPLCGQCHGTGLSGERETCFVCGGSGATDAKASRY